MLQRDMMGREWFLWKPISKLWYRREWGFEPISITFVTDVSGRQMRLGRATGQSLLSNQKSQQQSIRKIPDCYFDFKNPIRQA